MVKIGQEITIETPKGKIFKMKLEKFIPHNENQLTTFIGTHPAGGNKMSITGFRIK